MHFSCCGMIYPATACFFSPQKLSQQSRKGLFYPQTHSTQSPACCFIPLTAGKITHFSKKFPLIHTAPFFCHKTTDYYYCRYRCRKTTSTVSTSIYLLLPLQPLKYFPLGIILVRLQLSEFVTRKTSQPSYRFGGFRISYVWSYEMPDIYITCQER